MKLIIHPNEYKWGNSLKIMESNGKAFVRLYQYKDDNQTLYIEDLSVIETERRKGYAKELLNYIFEYAIQLNVKQIMLIAEVNTFMYEWYLRLGFKKFIYKTNEKNYIWMVKDI